MSKNSGNLGQAVDDILDFSEWAHYLYTKKTIIGLFVGLFFLIAFVYTKTLVPIYMSDSLLQVEVKQAKMPGIEEVTILLERGSRNLRAASSREESIIKSRTVVGAAVKSLDLQLKTHFNYFPYFGEAMARGYQGKGLASAPFGLTKYAWGGEYIKIDRLDVPAHEEKISAWAIKVLGEGNYLLLDGQGKEVLKGQVGAAASADVQGKEVGIFVSQLSARVGVEIKVYISPVLVAIDRLAAQVLVEERGERTGIISVSLAGKDKAQTQNTLNAVINSYVKYNLRQHSKEAKKMLAFLSKHLPKIKEREDLAEAELQQFRLEEGTVDLSSQAQTAMQTLASIDRSLAEIELKKIELLNVYTAKHPAIMSLKDKHKALEEERVKLMSGFQSLSEKELGYIKLVRKVKIANKMYLSMSSRKNGLLLAQEGASGNVSVIDYAEKPYVPLKQNIRVIWLAGIFFGFIFGFFWVAISRVLHRGVSDLKLLEAKSGVNVLASVMFSKAGEKLALERRKDGGLGLISLSDLTDIAVEGLRGLRTGVHFALAGSKNNVIVISGPTPGVGKSFVSSNFAAVYASTGKKILLVDGDIRKGGLHNLLGRMQPSPGLCELALGLVTPEDVVQKITDNFDFVSRGKTIKNASEALSSEMFFDFIEQSKKDYDVVIIDTPPILLVTDASVIAQQAAQLLMVVKTGVSQMNEVEHAVSQFRKAGVEVTGIVMNFVGKGSSYYGYGGSYGYNSKYKY